MIVAMETSNKIKEANENSEEISTGRRMSKLYISVVCYFKLEMTDSIN